MAQPFALLIYALNNMKDNLEACFKELQNNKASTPAQKVATQGNNHRRPSVGPSEVAHANESTENLTTWTNLCVDRKGAVVQTVDLKDGSKSHRRIGQYNPNIPRHRDKLDVKVDSSAQ